MFTLHDAALDELVLGRSLKGNKIHATLSAEVSAGQPVDLLTCSTLISPRVEVTLAVEAFVNRSLKKKERKHTVYTLRFPNNETVSIIF